MDIVDDQNKVVLHDNYYSAIKYSSLQHSETDGDFLIILAKHFDSITVNILKYDVDKLELFKQVVIKGNFLNFNRSDLHIKVFLDFENGRCYITERENAINTINGVSFSGEVQFKKVFTKKPNAKFVYKIEHIGNSMVGVLWMNFTVKEFAIETFNVTEYGLFSWKTFQIAKDVSDLVLETYWRMDTFRQFGQSFLRIYCGSKDNKRENIFIFDFCTGEQVFHHETHNHFNSIVDFNWNGFQEMALLTADKFPEDYDFYDYYDPEESDTRGTMFGIQVQNHCFKAKSLKNQARVACLKFVDETHLHERLPGCLKDYLGILQS